MSNLDLNEIDVSQPLYNAENSTIAADIRDLKTTFKNVILKAHNSDGSQKSAEEGGSTPINDDSVSTSSVQDSAITTIKLQDLSVTEGKIADQAVGSGKYKDASIPATAFQDSTIATSRLSGTIDDAHLASSPTTDSARAVGTDHIKDAAVTDAKIAAMALTKLTGGSDGDLLVKSGSAWTSASLSSGGVTWNGSEFVVSTGLKIALVGDSKTIAAAGGTTTANTWVTRTLGEFADPDNIIAFSGNKFSLLEGTYLVYLKAPAYQVNAHQTRLVLDDKTGSGDQAVAWGTSEDSGVGAGAAQTFSTIIAVIVVDDVAWEYRLEHWCETSTGTSDLGSPSNALAGLAGQAEVYTQGYFVKVG